MKKNSLSVRGALFGSRGFTLVELLVVVAIIGVLIAILLPAVQAVRESARKAACSNKIRQLAVGVLSFVDTNGRYPCQGFDSASSRSATNQGIGVFVMVLPFIEEVDLYTKWDQNNTSPDTSGVVKAFTCPSDQAPDKRSGYAYTNYGVVVTQVISRVQNGSSNTYTGVFPQGKNDYTVDPSAVSDGLSKTAMFAEMGLGRQSSPFLFRSRKYTPTGNTRAACNSASASSSDHTRTDRQPGARFGNTGQTNLTFAYRPNSAHCSNRDSVTYDGASASSMHKGGVHVVMADASAKFIADDVDAGSVGDDPEAVVLSTSSAANPKGVWGAMATREGVDYF